MERIMTQWYVNTGDGNRGPFDEGAMRNLIAQGHINGNTWA